MAEQVSASQLIDDLTNVIRDAESLLRATAAQTGGKGLCTACFTGGYPIPVDTRAQGKALLEDALPDADRVLPKLGS